MSKFITCLIVDDEAIARDIIEMHLMKMDHIEIVGKCQNAIEAFNIISQRDVDLVFLDINMPEISGIAFAKSINKGIKVIFTTAYREYAVEGFDLQALDYLLKPISFDRLSQAVNRYAQAAQASVSDPNPAKQEVDFIFVRADRQMQNVVFSDILYLESFSDYIKIHCRDKTIVTRETMTAMQAKLPTEQFLRIHRSFIISLSAIQSFTHEQMLIADKTLTISRSYKAEVIRVLQSY